MQSPWPKPQTVESGPVSPGAIDAAIEEVSAQDLRPSSGGGFWSVPDVPLDAPDLSLGLETGGAPEIGSVDDLFPQFSGASSSLSLLDGLAPPSTPGIEDFQIGPGEIDPLSLNQAWSQFRAQLEARQPLSMLGDVQSIEELVGATTLKAPDKHPSVRAAQPRTQSLTPLQKNQIRKLEELKELLHDRRQGFLPRSETKDIESLLNQLFDWRGPPSSAIFGRFDAMSDSELQRFFAKADDIVRNHPQLHRTRYDFFDEFQEALSGFYTGSN